jgi:hypothetical protein
VRVQLIRAEPSPLQAQAWRRLWRILLAPAEQAREPAPSPTAVQAGDETCAEDDQDHDGMQDVSRGRLRSRMQRPLPKSPSKKAP